MFGLRMRGLGVWGFGVKGFGVVEFRGLWVNPEPITVVNCSADTSVFAWKASTLRGAGFRDSNEVLRTWTFSHNSWV